MSQIDPPPVDYTRPQPDRWAHRRAEPRPLAIMWIMYLMVASVFTVGAMGLLGLIAVDVYRPAARVMFILTVVGMAILWPMIRLSQVIPTNPLRAAAADTIVMIIPLQTMIWPQAWRWMAAWPIDVIAALSTHTIAWTLLTGGLLAFAFTSAARSSGIFAFTSPARSSGIFAFTSPARSKGSSGLWRSAWMLTIITLSSLGPALGLLSARGDREISPHWLMTSPIAGIVEMTRDRAWTGQSAAVGRVHWTAIGLTACAGMCLWVLAAWRRSLQGPEALGLRLASHDGPLGIGREDVMELLTPAEKQQLEGRLAALVANRPVITLRIAEARALGDLKENGDYHAAREQQGMEEAEIRRLTERLHNVGVIDEKMAKAAEGVVFIGSTVKLKDLDDGDEDLFKLVGEGSSSPSFDYVEVTANSPMGEALMKARVGDEIRVNAPRGVKKFKIMEIV